MRKFKWDNPMVPKYLKKAKQSAGSPASAELNRAKKNITRQAMLAGLTVVLTIVILFAMTSAWYTNIVQTSGLMFQAEPWGFDGDIIVDETPIMAAPGDDGLVNLQVENDSDSISAISVNVSKNGMADEMQQRLFFYVDAQMNRGEETMDRVYLNAYEGYTYTVFDHGWLTLTDTVSNAPQIKWEWVYDVLGYYVLAQPMETELVNEETGETTTVRTMSIKEYLRPIEYDFDEATTVFKSGEDEELTVALDTVDGTWSPEEYLEIISQYDGYPGQVNTTINQPVDGYYPVDVDEETGYGVYAYLCSYPEILLNTQWDTELGELAYQNAKDPDSVSQEDKKKLSHVATLLISAQKNETSVVNVSTLDALEKAMVGTDADVIQLSSNINIPADDPLTIPKDTRVMVDLNGHTITAANTTSTPAVDALPGSSLTLTNGTISYEGTSTGKVIGVQSTGAEVVMSGISMTGFNYGINVADNTDDNQLDSRVHLMNCSIDANVYAVFISGNGADSAQKSQLIVEKSTLRSNTIVITGSGNDVQSGTDIQIIDSFILNNVDNQNVDITTSDLIQVGAGIYHPQQDGTLTIKNSTVIGYTGIALKGGTTNIVDSHIRGNGDMQKPEANNSGFTDTGDAIYVETTYGYEIGLHISGEGTKVSRRDEKAYCLQVFGEYTTNVLVQIEGGTFDNALDSDYLAPGCTITKKEEVWVVKKTAE